MYSEVTMHVPWGAEGQWQPSFSAAGGQPLGDFAQELRRRSVDGQNIATKSWSDISLKFKWNWYRCCSRCWSCCFHYCFCRSTTCGGGRCSRICVNVISILFYLCVNFAFLCFDFTAIFCLWPDGRNNFSILVQNQWHRRLWNNKSRTSQFLFDVTSRVLIFQSSSSCGKKKWEIKIKMK